MSFLPNPKKEAMCNYQTKDVAAAIRKIPTYVSGVQIVFESTTMNVFKLSCPGTGAFSLGMFLDISLHENAGPNTIVKLECRRQIGAIDKPNELHECTDYMMSAFNMIGKILDGTAEKVAQQNAAK